MEKLKNVEREKISNMLSQGLSKRAIARTLKRSVSTIKDEIDRNSSNGEYVAVNANEYASERRIKTNKSRHPLKNRFIFKYVIDHLRKGWSPEQICGRLKLDYDEKLQHESIYCYIYSDENKEKKLWEYLPRKQKKRRKVYGRKTQKSRIPNRVSRDERPVEVEDRNDFGHWEGDTVEGQAHKDGIHTTQERKSRKLVAKKIAKINSKLTVEAQKEIFEKYPPEAKKTLTVDNGKEFFDHGELGKTGIQIYFCDPYSSWQKGGLENANGLIRRYLPKKTDFSSLTQEELDEIVEEINNRPRKILNYRTANEVFDENLFNCSD